MGIRVVWIVAIGAMAVTMTACGDSTSSDEGAATVASVTTTTNVAQTTPRATATGAVVTETSTAAGSSSAAETSGAGGGAAAVAIMPQVVCMNLQAAQDKIQEAGVFFSRSEDATGQGRSQIIDSNWIVVAQRPAAGSPIEEGEAVLSAVKIGEPSSC